MRKDIRQLASSLCLSLTLLLAPGPASADSETVKVMTQNLYVGSDIFQLLDDSQPPPVIVAKIFSDLLQTDFSRRAEVIADIIAKRRPHLVGLQEVSLVRTECPSNIINPPHDPTPNAPEIHADYLQILLDALEARGADYDVVATIENVDGELPAVNGPVQLIDCPEPFFDVRLTDHDVTLKRRDVEATAVLEKNFVANFPVPTPAGTILFKRGFTVVDAAIKGREIRFVNTHLEPDGNPFGNFFQSVQAAEIVQTLDALSLLPGGEKPLVVAGDLNSSPDLFYSDCTPDPGTGVVVPDGCLTPYAIMTFSGYTDLWTIRDDDEWKPGYTCCQAPLLDNAESELSRRIDHVWYRASSAPGSGPDPLEQANAKVVGTHHKQDRTIDGLWSSDHAGVLGILEFAGD